MQTRFKLKFPDAVALRTAWEAELSAGRLFVPTGEMLPPFTPVVLAVTVVGMPTEVEFPAEVVFVLEAQRCSEGQKPGLGLSFRLQEHHRTALCALISGHAVEEAGEAAAGGEREAERQSAKVRPVQRTPAGGVSSVGRGDSGVRRDSGRRSAKRDVSRDGPSSRSVKGQPSGPRSVSGAEARPGRARGANFPTAPSFDAEADARVSGEVRLFLHKRARGTHYQALGVEMDVERKAVRRAYSKMMRQFHPDNYYRRLSAETFGRLEEVYQRVTEAYEVLIDPERRASYDLSIGNFQGAVQEKRAQWRKQSYSNINPRLAQLATSLYEEGTKLELAGQVDKARAKFKLALQYNPHMDEVSARLKVLGSQEG